MAYGVLFHNKNDVEDLLSDVNILIENKFIKLNRSQTDAWNYLVEYLELLFPNSHESLRLVALCFEMLEDQCIETVNIIKGSSGSSTKLFKETLQNLKRDYNVTTATAEDKKNMEKS